ncbi:hypothetical protein CBL_00050 [Carabus blaptoides fortunei]
MFLAGIESTRDEFYCVKNSAQPDPYLPIGFLSVVPVQKISSSSPERVSKDNIETKKSKSKNGKNATEVELQLSKTETSKTKKRTSSPMLEQNNSKMKESITNGNEQKKSKISKKSTSKTTCPAKIVENDCMKLDKVLPEKLCEGSIRKKTEKSIAEHSNECRDLPPKNIKTIIVEDTAVNSSITDTSTLNQSAKISVQKWNCKNWIPPLVEVIQMCNKTSNESADVSNSEETASEFVTKRRRNRVRPRKRKRLENGDNELDTSHSESAIFHPPKSRAAPVSHIKFTDVEDGTKQSLDNETNLDTNKQFYHSTPYNKQNYNNIDSEPVDSNVSDRTNKMIVPEKQIDLSKVHLKPLSNGQPVVGNVLLFQRLKLGNDYSPEISKTILAEVKEVSKDGNQLTLKVLDGHEEFEDPKGKFSCIPEEGKEEDTNNITLIESVQVDKNSMIDAKLVIT